MNFLAELFSLVLDFLPISGLEFFLADGREVFYGDLILGEDFIEVIA